MWSKSKHIIKLVLSIVQKTILVHAPQQGLSLKQSLLRCLQLGPALCQPMQSACLSFLTAWFSVRKPGKNRFNTAYFVLCQQCTCSLSHLGQSHLYTPKLPLVAETILPNQLQFTIKTFLLKRTSRLLEGLTDCKDRRGQLSPSS